MLRRWLTRRRNRAAAMTTRNDAPKLLDVMTRHQIYLEGVKQYQYDSYNQMVLKLRADIRNIFMDIDYDDMSKLTKKQLDDFIRALKRAQIIRFSSYTEQVLQDLRKYMAADTEMNVRIMQATQEETDPESEQYDEKKTNWLLALLAPAKTAALWALVLNTVLPANGQYVETMLKNFTARGTVDIENLMRKARSNGMTTKQAMALLLGTARLNYKDGLLERMLPQSDAMIATLWQHAAGIAQAQAAALIFDWYQWVSVLDGHTSDICRSRNGKVWRYGEGPLPPAHARCRSKTVPVAGRGGYDDVDDSYYTWLKRQPADVQDDILGKQKASDLRAGRVKAADVPKFSDAKPLTVAQFLGKLSKILG